MSPPAAKDYLAQQMSEQEYLDTEPYSEVKREYIDGYVYAMAGAKASHNRIVGNVHGELRNYLKGKPCQPYMSDMKVKVGKKYFLMCWLIAPTCLTVVYLRKLHG